MFCEITAVRDCVMHSGYSSLLAVCDLTVCLVFICVFYQFLVSVNVDVAALYTV